MISTSTMHAFSDEFIKIAGEPVQMLEHMSPEVREMVAKHFKKVPTPATAHMPVHAPSVESVQALRGASPKAYGPSFSGGR